jgi:RNA polymerase sigma-70 factor (ECF subfamily)
MEDSCKKRLVFSELIRYERDGEIADGRVYPDALQPVEPFTGLGRSGELEGFLRYLLAVDLCHCAQVRPNEAEAQDVVQETVICVARDIDKFKRDRKFGSFKGWLRNLTRWRIADQLRSRKPNALGEDGLSNGSNRLVDLAEIPDPVEGGLEAVWEAEWQSNLMEAALERVKRRVKEEHYQMFDLNVVREWPANKVAKTLEVSVAQVYLAKHRLLALLKKEVRMLERQW